MFGFDLFDSEKKDDILSKDGEFDKAMMNLVYSKVDSSELSLESVNQRINNMQIQHRHILVKGDCAETMPVFLTDNPGLRVALIYIDVDLERPTYHALINLWERLLPGGIILFDEYEYHKFSESNGVDPFLKEFNSF